jgi:hypothetical protein
MRRDYGKPGEPARLLLFQPSAISRQKLLLFQTSAISRQKPVTAIIFLFFVRIDVQPRRG